MKNLIITAAFMFAAVAVVIAQTVTVQNVTISYNAEAAKNVGFSLDVTNNANGGSGSGLCKNAYVAIGHVQKLCGCVLTPNQVLDVFNLAKEVAPDWALDNAGVKKL